MVAWGEATRVTTCGQYSAKGRVGAASVSVMLGLLSLMLSVLHPVHIPMVLLKRGYHTASDVSIAPPLGYTVERPYCRMR